MLYFGEEHLGRDRESKDEVAHSGLCVLLGSLQVGAAASLFASLDAGKTFSIVKISLKMSKNLFYLKVDGGKTVSTL